MPVTKFKSFDDAAKALWNVKPDKNYYESVSKLFDLKNRISKTKIPKGVFKFKTFEEAGENRK